MTITARFAALAGITRIFSKRLYDRTFAFRRIVAGKLSRPGMAFQPCRNEELFQPALAAEMPLTSMIPQG